VLRLEHAANTETVTAYFDLLDASGNVTSTTEFDDPIEPPQIFVGEDFTRVQIIGNGPLENTVAVHQTDYFNITVDQDGNWLARLRNGSAAVQALAEGEVHEEQVTVQVTDEHGAVGEHTMTLRAIGRNDAPVLTAPAILDAVGEDDTESSGSTVSALFDPNFQDADGGSSLGGVAVAGNTADPLTEGVWQFSFAGTDLWFDIGAVSETQALLLDAAAMLRFLPAENFSGDPQPLTVFGIDETYAGPYSSYQNDALTRANGVVDGANRGGTTPVSLNPAEVQTASRRWRMRRWCLRSNQGAEPSRTRLLSARQQERKSITLCSSTSVTIMSVLSTAITAVCLTKTPSSILTAVAASRISTRREICFPSTCS